MSVRSVDSMPACTSRVWVVSDYRGTRASVLRTLALYCDTRSRPRAQPLTPSSCCVPLQGVSGLLQRNDDDDDSRRIPLATYVHFFPPFTHVTDADVAMDSVSPHIASHTALHISRISASASTSVYTRIYLYLLPVSPFRSSLFAFHSSHPHPPRRPPSQRSVSR